MTHRHNIVSYLNDHPNICDDCIARELEISYRQTVNRICSTTTALTYLRGKCRLCGNLKKIRTLRILDEIGDSKPTKTKMSAKARKRPIVREEDLQSKFNAAITEVLGISEEDYYSRLDFDGLLRLKAALARVHDIVTLKLTFALAEWIARRWDLNEPATAALRFAINEVAPNASGFDFDSPNLNIIGEVKGMIPMNAGERFGSAQLKSLTSDVLQLLGKPALGKTQGELSVRHKTKRPNRDTAIKLIGVYDSPNVRVAAQDWRSRLMASKLWKGLEAHSIQDAPIDAGFSLQTLSAQDVYLVYLKPMPARSTGYNKRSEGPLAVRGLVQQHRQSPNARRRRE